MAGAGPEGVEPRHAGLHPLPRADGDRGEEPQPRGRGPRQQVGRRVQRQEHRGLLQDERPRVGDAVRQVRPRGRLAGPGHRR